MRDFTVLGILCCHWETLDTAMGDSTVMGSHDSGVSHDSVQSLAWQLLRNLLTSRGLDDFAKEGIARAV